MRYLDSETALTKKTNESVNCYDAESILNELGFKFYMNNKQSFSGFHTKYYSSSNGNYGCLLIDSSYPERDKIFFEYDEKGNQVSIIVFGKNIDIVEYIPERYGTGVVELSNRKYHMGTMSYYNSENRRKRSTGESVSPTLSFPVYTENPCETIKRVKEWAHDIKLENLKSNPVFRKKNS